MSALAAAGWFSIGAAVVLVVDTYVFAVGNRRRNAYQRRLLDELERVERVDRVEVDPPNVIDARRFWS